MKINIRKILKNVTVILCILTLIIPVNSSCRNINNENNRTDETTLTSTIDNSTKTSSSLTTDNITKTNSTLTTDKNTKTSLTVPTDKSAKTTLTVTTDNKTQTTTIFTTDNNTQITTISSTDNNTQITTISSTDNNTQTITTVTTDIKTTLTPKTFSDTRIPMTNTDSNTTTTKASGGTETTDYIQYDYIEFGSYPQSEIVSQASDSGVYGKDWCEESDYIVDADLYNTLKSLSEDKWDTNGDTTLDGNKYRRIKASNATYSTSSSINYYNWSSSETYHYFKYEPIKWIILEQNGNDLFVISEIALDNQKYNTNITNITWETSTIRSWLNGYDSSQNAYGTDYSSNNFINTAFTTEEQSKIKTTALENEDNINSGTEGGNNTNDKIYFLSENDVYGSNATAYGFDEDYNTHDTARQTKSSTYAKAMGNYVDCENGSIGNCYWWLRSPGSYVGLAVLVRCDGSVYRGGQHINSNCRSIRPALHLVYNPE